jgi:hypothetical protein
MFLFKKIDQTPLLSKSEIVRISVLFWEKRGLSHTIPAIEVAVALSKTSQGGWRCRMGTVTYP